MEQVAVIKLISKSNEESNLKKSWLMKMIWSVVVYRQYFQQYGGITTLKSHPTVKQRREQREEIFQIFPSFLVVSFPVKSMTNIHTHTYREVINWNYPANKCQLETRADWNQEATNKIVKKKKMYGASLVAQQEGICLPVQETWVWSLIQEDPRWQLNLGATIIF